ncbi:hypothetical protein [Streptomyces sp. Caat 7-52]|uniref:hypothetical protein n=1 Tax=Streptomyces sp. Caat 7-52 TaxID=2949637 RepID=UPI00203504E9|nr:hypothetical protein [Streptomyces sp. Caat 7-52]
MFTKLSKAAVSAAALAAAVAMAAPAPASAASDPLRCVRTTVHFDLAKGQTPESIALGPDGTAYVTLAKARQVAAVSRYGGVRVLATLPEPADGGIRTPALGFPLTPGVVRAQDGTLYFLYATGTADLTGVWRLRPGGRPQRITALPATGLPNGLALDARTRTLYVTDSILGTVWRVAASGGTASAWSTDPALAPAGFLGANGLKIHNGALWATNLDKGTIVRIPLLADGRAGTARVTATGLSGIDDFAFTGDGDGDGDGDQIIAALNTVNQVALIRSDGTRTIVLTAADGLQGPTSIALRGNTVHVISAAYLTARDPNLILAHLGS